MADDQQNRSEELRFLTMATIASMQKGPGYFEKLMEKTNQALVEVKDKQDVIPVKDQWDIMYAIGSLLMLTAKGSTYMDIHIGMDAAKLASILGAMLTYFYLRGMEQGRNPLSENPTNSLSDEDQRWLSNLLGNVG